MRQKEYERNGGERWGREGLGRGGRKEWVQNGRDGTGSE